MSFIDVHSLRQRFVEGPDSLGQRARDRRWLEFHRSFPNLEQYSVLDLGGTVEWWTRAPVRPKSVHMVNVTPEEEPVPSWLTSDVGDACALDDELLDGRFDLVYSNSVIEHVGGHVRRVQFADMVGKAAPYHWIQTPYRYFPVEPHLVAPVIQWFPLWARAQIARRWPLAHSRGGDFGSAVAAQMRTELLDITLLRHYFPDSEIRYERFAGLVKSIIAFRAPPPGARRPLPHGA